MTLRGPRTWKRRINTGFARASTAVLMSYTDCLIELRTDRVWILNLVSCCCCRSVVTFLQSTEYKASKSHSFRGLGLPRTWCLGDERGVRMNTQLTLRQPLLYSRIFLPLITTMSYADAAAKGPHQSPEDVSALILYFSCIHLTKKKVG